MSHVRWIFAILCFVALGLFAITYPTLNRGGGRAPEATMIGEMRTVLSGLQDYGIENCGFYPATLTDASRYDGTPVAIPHWPENEREFVPSYLSAPKPWASRAYRSTYQPFGRPEFIPSRCVPGSVLEYCYSSLPVHQFKSDWVNAHPWLADVLPFDFERYRSFMGMSTGAMYTDPLGRDLSCIDGKPPEFAIFLE